MAFVSGWGGRALVGSTALPVLRWQVSDTTELADTTAGPVTVRSYTLGYKDYEVSLELLWDTNLDVYNPASAAYLQAGWSIALTLYYDQTKGSRSFTLPNVMVSNVTLEDEVRGVFRYTLSGKQSGDTGIVLPRN